VASSRPRAHGGTAFPLVVRRTRPFRWTSATSSTAHVFPRSTYIQYGILPNFGRRMCAYKVAGRITTHRLGPSHRPSRSNPMTRPSAVLRAAVKTPSIEAGLRRPGRWRPRPPSSSVSCPVRETGSRPGVVRASCSARAAPPDRRVNVPDRLRTGRPRGAPQRGQVTTHLQARRR